MADLLAGIVGVFAGLLQIVVEFFAIIIAAIFRGMFSKQAVDEKGEPISNPMENPSNRWEIFGYSMLGTLIVALAIGGTVYYAWGTFRSFLISAAVVMFLGAMGAVKAATN